MKDVKILIVPDVHARDFWVEPVNDVLENSDAHIIFLGDYLDPYNHEWEEEDVDPQKKAIITLKNIIKLKQEHPDRITLLFGNHDSGYMFGDDFWCSRMDYKHKYMISKLFLDNYDLFQVAEIREVNGKKFVFSHAGISREYVKLFMCSEDDTLPTIDEVVEILNKGVTERTRDVLVPLSLYSSYRGRSGFSFGSPIWSDIREWIGKHPDSTPFEGVVNILGHTQLNGDEAINIKGRIYDLDVRQCFFIDSLGEVNYWDSNKPVEENKIGEEE